MRTRPALTHDDVQKILRAAEAEAGKHPWNVAIAVLDDGGHLLGLSRLDGATPANVEIALEKGRTAALSRTASKVFEDRIAAGRLAMLKLPLLPLQGGLPIVYQGECVGAVGVSGAKPQEDEQVAQAGIDGLGG